MPGRMTYRLTATMIATFEISATSLDAAKIKLSNILNNQEANFGSTPEGDPLVAAVSVEGEIDSED